MFKQQNTGQETGLNQKLKVDKLINEKELYRLYAIYRLFTINYSLKIEDVETFLRYVYAMDVLWLNVTWRPFIWQDYIFIDDNMINEFIISNNNKPILHEDDFDHLAKIDHDFAKRIVTDGINNLKISLPINHMDHIPDEGREYFEDAKESAFLFVSEEYSLKLKSKRRERSLSKLLN